MKELERRRRLWMQLRQRQQVEDGSQVQETQRSKQVASKKSPVTAKCKKSQQSARA